MDFSIITTTKFAWTLASKFSRMMRTVRIKYFSHYIWWWCVNNTMLFNYRYYSTRLPGTWKLFGCHGSVFDKTINMSRAETPLQRRVIPSFEYVGVEGRVYTLEHVVGDGNCFFHWIARSPYVSASHIELSSVLIFSIDITKGLLLINDSSVLALSIDFSIFSTWNQCHSVSSSGWLLSFLTDSSSVWSPSLGSEIVLLLFDPTDASDRFFFF